MTQIDRAAPVLVTGGSGYIAGWIIKLLLEQGRSVRTTVRDLKKAEHLQALAARTQGSLECFRADLLKAGDFDRAARGCQLVIHTASPFLISGYTDPEAELVRPAVEGTRNVLEAANRSETVRRVVLTSSIAAIFGDNADLRDVPEGVFTEQHWNTTSTLDRNPYQYSKLLAEKEAIRIQAAQSRWDLVTLNPGVVFGPSLTKTTCSGSVGLLVGFGRGTYRRGVGDFQFGCVDVRDVARAHIAAGDTPAAQGRNIVSAGVLSLLEIGDVLRKSFPAYPLPTRTVSKPIVWLIGPLTSGVSRPFVSRNLGFPLRVDNTKAKRDLGLDYRPLPQTLTEHFQQLVDDRLV